MRVWTNYVDWVVAADLDDVRKVLVEQYGDTPEIDTWIEEGFTPLDDDKPITITNYSSGDPLTLTCADWIAREGRGHLCSTEY